VFLHPIFLVSFLGTFAGFGASVFVLSQAQQIWLELSSHYPDFEPFGNRILLIFSISNACNNFFSGVLSDFLNKRSILSHQKYLAIVMGLCSVLLATIATIFKVVPHPSRPIVILCGVFLGLQGEYFLPFSVYTHV
jgi:sugar phosphate permease